MSKRSEPDHPLPESWQENLAPYGMGYRVKILSQLLSRKFQEQLEPYGLTPFHWVVLCCLWQEDGLSTSAIGERLQQVGGTLTGVLDRMEQRDLIRRQRDSNDRRIWRIWLTEEGEKLKYILPPIALNIKQQTLQDFSPTEVKQLSDYLDRAIANLS